MIHTQSTAQGSPRPLDDSFNVTSSPRTARRAPHVPTLAELTLTYVGNTSVRTRHRNSLPRNFKMAPFSRTSRRRRASTDSIGDIRARIHAVEHEPHHHHHNHSHPPSHAFPLPPPFAQAGKFEPLDLDEELNQVSTNSMAAIPTPSVLERVRYLTASEL